MDERIFARIDRRARAQYGLITRQQLAAMGCSNRVIHGMMAASLVVQVHAAVYRLAGVPVTWHQRQLAAVLAAGGDAAASHRAAAYLWGLLPGEPEVVEIVVCRSRLPRPEGVIVHRSRDLCPDVISVRRGIPTVNPMRTMVDLGAVLPCWEVQDCLERGLDARLFSVAAIEWAYTDVARPGRRGCGVLRRVLEDRALGARPASGLLEPRMARLIRDGNLPDAEYQYEVCDAAGRFVARVDFAWPLVKLAVEVDGYEHHSTPKDMERHYDRQHLLEAQGWLVRRFLWPHVVRHPGRVAAAIRRDLARLGAF